MRQNSSVFFLENAKGPKTEDICVRCGGKKLFMSELERKIAGKITREVQRLQT